MPLTVCLHHNLAVHMHRALTILEITQIICSYFVLEEPSLAALARTCTIFHGPALDALWSTQNSMKPHVQLLESSPWYVFCSRFGLIYTDAIVAFAAGYNQLRLGAPHVLRLSSQKHDGWVRPWAFGDSAHAHRMSPKWAVIPEPQESAVVQIRDGLLINPDFPRPHSIEHRLQLRFIHHQCFLSLNAPAHVS